MKSKINTFLFRKFKKIETNYHELNYLFWECTTRCNLNCIHCGSDCSKDSKHKDMPLEDFLNALKTIKTIPKNFTVVITGGEPLMRKDIASCGLKIRRLGFKWSMVSNGLLYTAVKHNELLNAGLGALTFSLDGLEDNHNWMRGNNNSFNKIDSAIDLVTSSPHINFDIVSCVNKKNLNELESIYLYLLKKGVKSWRLFTIVPIGRATDNPDLHLNNKEFTQMMEFISSKREIKEMDVKFSCEGYVGKYESKVRDTGFFCRAGINIGSVLIDGSISACPNIDRSFTQGNIYHDNLNEIWNNKYQEFRNREWTKKGQCEHCSEYKNCEGNGIHYWHGDKENVLVCHHHKTL